MILLDTVAYTTKWSCNLYYMYAVVCIYCTVHLACLFISYWTMQYQNFKSTYLAARNQAYQILMRWRDVQRWCPSAGVLAQIYWGLYPAYECTCPPQGSKCRWRPITLGGLTAVMHNSIQWRERDTAYNFIDARVCVKQMLSFRKRCYMRFLFDTMVTRLCSKLKTAHLKTQLQTTKIKNNAHIM